MPVSKEKREKPIKSKKSDDKKKKSKSESEEAVSEKETMNNNDEKNRSTNVSEEHEQKEEREEKEDKSSKENLNWEDALDDDNDLVVQEPPRQFKAEYKGENKSGFVKDGKYERHNNKYDRDNKQDTKRDTRQDTRQDTTKTYQKPKGAVYNNSALNFNYAEYENLQEPACSLSTKDLLRVCVARAEKDRQFALARTLKQTLRAMNFECDFPSKPQSSQHENREDFSGSTQDQTYRKSVPSGGKPYSNKYNKNK